jgi:hypothetical protein
MPIKKRPTKKKPLKLAKATLEVFDIAVENLIPDEDNPNEMDEATFDQLVEEIREQGFDEPIQVREHPSLEGKFQIGSGHHRTKAAIVLGMSVVPAIIKDWSDREIKVALVKRNVLRGDPNKQKLVALYRDLAKGKDSVQVQRELGFTSTKKFEALYEQAAKNLNPKQRKKLDEAKETIKSVDDLSSVLNKIFKESGSELDKGYMVFSFGGKKHHYFQIDKTTQDNLETIIAHCEKHDIPYTDVMQSIVADALNGSLPTSAKAKATKRKPVRKPKK